jgi:hypothetical protein
MKLHDDGVYTLEVKINEVSMGKSQKDKVYEFVLESTFSDNPPQTRKHYFNRQTLLNLSDYIKTIV